ncbi:Nuclear receptor ROR-gamma, partial [Frankliniella fusca]
RSRRDQLVCRVPPLQQRRAKRTGLDDGPIFSHTNATAAPLFPPPLLRAPNSLPSFGLPFRSCFMRNARDGDGCNLEMHRLRRKNNVILSALMGFCPAAHPALWPRRRRRAQGWREGTLRLRGDMRGTTRKCATPTINILWSINRFPSNVLFRFLF